MKATAAEAATETAAEAAEATAAPSGGGCGDRAQRRRTPTAKYNFRRKRTMTNRRFIDVQKAAGAVGTVLGAQAAAISAVFADTAELPADAAQGGLASFLPLLGYLAFFGVIMYVMIYLPQKRRDKKAKELINSLQVGFTVTTHSGVVGKVINIKDDLVTIESGVERTQIEFKKWAIRDVDKPIEA
jgi:preprotein translocase subunit YajC